MTGKSEPVGHPELVAKLASEIHTSGPITFARFMEQALYDPEFGYYTRLGPGPQRIGWEGDYYTSGDVHPAFGRALARQIHQIDELLGQPDPFTLIEMGPGKGFLARDLLVACTEGCDSLAQRLQLILCERSPAMQALQKEALRPLDSPKANVSWIEGLEEVATGSVSGVLFSNELVDAFPVHRVRVVGGELKEIYVDYRDGRFCEQLQPLSTPDLARYFQRLDLTLREGQTAEVNLQAVRWMKEVARVLERGLTITIDYGHSAHDLYSPERSRGTLMCYRHHQAVEDPYKNVGLQDMTAHVDFSSLAMAGEVAGLRVTGFTNHMSFLAGLGIEKELERLESESQDAQSIINLLRPQGMGRTFKILIQHKGIELPELDGLRYKPFFESALGTPSGSR